MIELKDVYSYYGTAASGVLWNLLAERPAKANISHRRMPSLQEHQAFIDAKPYRVWFLINADLAPIGFGQIFGWHSVGAIYATRRNEIGIAILRRFHRRGLARQAITRFVKDVPPLPEISSERVGHYIANISPENEGSHALFEGLGCTLAQLTYRFPEPA